jgi:chromosome partitioning protein
MPTIAFVSPKGGVGKTTAALLVADALCDAVKGGVTLIDADPNHPLQRWADGGRCPKTLTVISTVNEDNVIDVVEEATGKSAFVIVDLEGTANKIVLLAVSQADLVIIPCQGSQLDAEQASRAVHVIKQHEKMTKRSVPFALLLTRTGTAVKTRTLKHLASSLERSGYPVLKTQLHEREAFRAVFSFRERLKKLDPGDVANIERAVANVEELVREIVEVFRVQRPAAAAVA